MLHEYEGGPGQQQRVEVANGSNGRMVNGARNGLNVSRHIVLNPTSTPPKDDDVQGRSEWIGAENAATLSKQ